VAERALTGKRIETNGLTLNVVDEGRGPAVVLLHGFPDSADLWRHQMPALVQAGFRVVAPDMRGFGDSDRPPSVDDYVIFNAIADVRGIMDALGIERAHVVGHDYGAVVAWLLAAGEPSRVERLAALSLGHPGTFTRPLISQLKRSWYTFMFQFAGVAENLLSRDEWRLMRDWAAGSPDVERYLEDLSRPGALTAGLNWYRANTPPEIWGIDFPYPEIAAPTLGIWSSRDSLLGEEQMIDSVQYLTGPWRYERFDDVGHWIPIEEPERLNALLLEFLRADP
jgi:pimeloyl-ACP methyl ester carboxylesterase